MTFFETPVAKLLKEHYVESRLHMDGEDVLPAQKFGPHRLLQSELIGSRAAPHYAILDPKTGEFLARHRLSGPPGPQWGVDFVQFLSRPDPKTKKT